MRKGFRHFFREDTMQLSGTFLVDATGHALIMQQVLPHGNNRQRGEDAVGGIELHRYASEQFLG